MVYTYRLLNIIDQLSTCSQWLLQGTLANVLYTKGKIVSDSSTYVPDRADRQCVHTEVYRDQPEHPYTLGTSCVQAIIMLCKKV